MGAEQVNLQPAGIIQKGSNGMPGLPGVPKGKIVPREVLNGAISAQIAANDPHAALKELEPQEVLPPPVDYSKLLGSGSVAPVVGTATEPVIAEKRKPGRPAKAKPENLMQLQGPDRHGDQPDPPPATRREYEAEQRMLDGIRPEITEIFEREVNIPPTGFVGQPVTYQKPQGNTEPLKQVIVEHKIADIATAYQFTETLVTYIDSQCLTFAQGQVIYDAALIENLISNGVTCLIPVDQARDFIKCPSCHHEFPPSAKAKVSESLAAYHFQKPRTQ